MIQIGDKVYRNLQEQVAKNQEDIKDLQDEQIDAYTKTESDARFEQKLISGTTIKTVNNQSILGSGNLEVTTHLYAHQINWSVKAVGGDNNFNGEVYFTIINGQNSDMTRQEIENYIKNDLTGIPVNGYLVDETNGQDYIVIKLNLEFQNLLTMQIETQTYGPQNFTTFTLDNIYQTKIQLV